ncbi:2,3-diaminopropionate biosynthesis protein SbnA, partial [Streptomyces sp. NPDC001514]
AVAIAPDLGERYLDTVYHTNWLHALYGEDVLDYDYDYEEPAADSPAPDPASPTRSPGGRPQ